MRKASFYIIFVLLQLLVAEVALQSYYRLANGDWLMRRVALPIFEEDDVRVYRNAANLDFKHATNEFNVRYYTDNMGFRSAAPGHTTTVEKPADTYRILFLGPSFSFGTASQYEDMYVTLIAEQLQVSGKKIEVINLGTPSQPIRWQLCWVKEMAPKFSIDLVVHSVYGYSILAESDCDRTPPLPFVEDGFILAEDPGLAYRIEYYSKKSALVFYAWYLYEIVAPPDETRQGLGTEFYQQVASGTANTTHGKGYYKRLVFEGYTPYIENIRSWLGEQQKLAILFVPFSYIIHPESAKRFGDPENVPDRSDLMIRALAASEALDELGVTFIDPTEALLDKAESERQYNVIDVHFTQSGNRTVADYAAPVLQQIIDE